MSRFQGIPVGEGAFESPDQQTTQQPRRKRRFSGVPVDEGAFGDGTSEARTPQGAPIRGVTQEEFEALPERTQALAGQAAQQRARAGGPVDAAPDAEAEVLRGAAEGMERRLEYIPGSVTRAGATGLMKAGMSGMSLLARGAEFTGLAESGAGDVVNKLSGAATAGRRAANEDAWTPQVVNDAVESSVQSLTEMFTAGKIAKAAGLGKAGQGAAVIGSFATNAANQALTRGREAGLEGSDLAAYAAGQGAIEGTVTAAFQLAGAGGLEKTLGQPIRQGIRAGLKEAAKQFGVRSVAELPEELLILGAQQGVDYLAGVSEDKVPSSKDVATTVLSTLMSVGGAQALQQARPDVRGRIEERMARRTQEEAEGDREAGQAEPITDPARLLEAPASAEDQLQAIETETAQERAEAEKQAESGQTIVVDPQGRAMSQEQADELEQAGAQVAQPQTDPQRLLGRAATGERGQRFTAYPDGGLIDEAARGPRKALNVATQEDQEGLIRTVGPHLAAERSEALRPDQYGSFQRQTGNQTMFGERGDAQAYRDRLLERNPDTDVEVSKTLDGAAWTVSTRTPADSVAEAFKRDASQTQQKRMRRQLGVDSLDDVSNNQIARAMLETGSMTDSVRQIVNPQQPAQQEAVDQVEDFVDEGGRRRLSEAGRAVEQRAKNRKAGQPVLHVGLTDFDRARSIGGQDSATRRAAQAARIVREEAGDKATVTNPAPGRFGVVWEKGTSQREAKRIARRIQQRVGDETVAPGVTVKAEAGVGVVKPQTTFDNAYKQAVASAEAPAGPTPQTAEKAAKPQARKLNLAADPQSEQRRRAQLKAAEAKRRRRREQVFAQEAKRKAQAVAAQYKQETNRGTPEPDPVQSMDTDKAGRIAMAYENMQHRPDDPQVRAQYEAFKQETLDQFNALKDAGYTFDLQPVMRVAEMYPDTASLSRDLGQNQHLSVNADPGDMRADHPLNETAPDTGGWTYNQVFRAVHDVFGHAQTGNQLDILGEENAWRSHVAMYSPQARGAMTTETRGQSNWVGYGPYGEQNRQKIKEDNIGEVQFPEQKAGLLPDTYWTVKGMQPQPKAGPAVSPADGRAARKAAREEAAENVGPKQVNAVVDTIDDIFFSIAPRIRQVSPRVFRRVKQMMFDMGTHEERLQARFHNVLEPLHQEIGDWKSAHGQRVAAALLTDREQAKEIVSEEAAAGIDRAGEIFDNLRQQLIDAGVDVGYIENMWPRVVTDLKGLRKHLNQDERGEIDRALASARNVKGRDLSHEEKVAVVNQYLRGRGPVDPAKVGPRHTRARSLDVVSETMVPMYQSPTLAGQSYIRDMVKAIHRSRFFGRGEVTEENLSQSVGNYIESAIAEGEISPQQQEQLDKLLQALFTGDMARSGSLTRGLKQLSYFSFLTNFMSALTQVADAAGNIYLNGPTAAIRGYGDALRRRGSARRMTMEELGLHDYGAEWDDVGKMATVLDWALRKHGFKRLDRLGKEGLINATKHRLRQAAANPQGKAARDLQSRYGDIFTEDEWTDLFHNVRNGKVTEQERFLAFLHLANIQPTDVSETPVGYANNSSIFGNTAVQSRLLYTLKTFLFKRMDFIRRETIGEWQKGNKLNAAKNGAALWLLWSAFEIPIDLLKDFFRGKLRWENLPDTAVDAMLGLVGMNRYLLDSFMEDPAAAVANYFTGAFGGGVFTDAISDLTQGITGHTPDGYEATPGMRWIRHIPWVGGSLYYLSPIGEGYHITNEQDERSAKDKFRQIRQQAQDAIRRGDSFDAHTLLQMYNDNKHITGRKTNLTQKELKQELIRERSNPLDQGGF